MHSPLGTLAQSAVAAQGLRTATRTRLVLVSRRPGSPAARQHSQPRLADLVNEILMAFLPLQRSRQSARVSRLSLVAGRDNNPGENGFSSLFSPELAPYSSFGCLWE